MKRFHKKYEVGLTPQFKHKLLHWAQQFDDVAWLDSNFHDQKHTSYQAILAVDAFTGIQTDVFKAFEKLEEYQSTIGDWVFGYLTYDLKNDVERLFSVNHDALKFPDLYFFQPKRLFLFSEDHVDIHYLNMIDDELESDWEAIMTSEVPLTRDKVIEPPKIKLRTSKDTYFEKLSEMLGHIERGDIYEANFCQEFYAEHTDIDPLQTFFHLNDISTPPFASYLKVGERHVLSASPERYLKKTGNVIISQPIKGTAARLKDSDADEQMKRALESDPKERSENIMITDLVRNDLSRIAKKGSVAVEELCKIYTFEQVHQMITTVRCEVDESITPVQIIRNTFPMGSMTGAPKVSAMKIIDRLEDAKRGIYSGAIGYFTPSGDFDFSVVIRSILYDSLKRYVSFSVGGAITAKSIPEKEYEECLLKGKAMRQALERS